MQALSLIELMVVVAVVAILAGLTIPSFSSFIVKQRVRSVHAQVVTDMHFTRSEAVSRGSFVSMRFQSSPGAGGASCYVIYTRPEPIPGVPVNCNCLAPAGTRCNDHPGTTTEIRTVIIPNDGGVSLRLPSGQNDTLTYDPRTGNMRVQPVDVLVSAIARFEVTTSADTQRAVRTVVLGSGRPQVCAPTGSLMGGDPCS